MLVKMYSVFCVYIPLNAKRGYANEGIVLH